MLATALGPFIGAALASLLNGYAAMFLVLGGIAAVAAALAAATATVTPGSRRRETTAVGQTERPPTS
jgi:MFS family permease